MASDVAFPQFQLLPPEIRCQIWRHCFRQRTVPLGYRRDGFRTHLYLWPPQDISQPIASACYDAWRETLFDRKAVTTALSHPWLNPSTDTVYIRAPDSYEDLALSPESKSLLQLLLSSGVTISFHHRLLTDWSIWAKCPHNRTPHEIWRQLKDLVLTSGKRLQVVVMESDFLLTRDEALSSGLWGPFAGPGDVAYHGVEKFLRPSHGQRALSLSCANRVELYVQHGVEGVTDAPDWHEVGVFKEIQERVRHWRERASQMTMMRSQWFDHEARRRLASLRYGQDHYGTFRTAPAVRQQRVENWVRLCDGLEPEMLVPVVKLQWILHSVGDADGNKSV
ncbi:hypothetical protein QBC41DRAFT_328365 [Cercophora samala]|uniref:2EXR domain-containing protein n=1 Tax=Cercophora samala TaxID=330535 RepID=A0AA39Z6M4_9PEZI|nr:hypothetical protein QBC41DRAFT_328365 [Cercophora samala]